MQTQDDVGKFSLERLNVIQVGNKIGSQVTRKYYPKDLVSKTDIIFEEIPDYSQTTRNFMIDCSTSW